MSKPEFLLWCDLETTGLDPDKHKILEIALVFTDPELNELDRGSWIFKSDIEPSKVSPEVMKMHFDNGLWMDTIDKGLAERSVDSHVVDFVGKTLGNSWTTRNDKEFNAMERRWKNTYLAGSSVNFDRSFLAKRYYWINNSLSHRVVDVSVVRTMIKMWKPELLWEQNTTHRAMDDILDHIEELKYYRKVLGLGAEN